MKSSVVGTFRLPFDSALTIAKFFASMNGIFCHYSLDIRIKVNAAIANVILACSRLRGPLALARSSTVINLEQIRRGSIIGQRRSRASSNATLLSGLCAISFSYSWKF